MTQRRRTSVRERPEWQCRYRGGECLNARTTKIDGSLHHLCQEHRLRANLNQRRCQQRQRRNRNRLRQPPTPQPEGRRTPTLRRRQARDDQLRRLDYTEWLQIIDSLDLQDVTNAVSSLEAPATPAMSENELFAPIAAELAIHPALQDPALGDDIFYLIGSDIGSHIPSLSGEDTIPDTSDSG